MDNLNELIKSAEKLLAQAKNIKCDSQAVNNLYNDELNKLEKAKKELEKTLKDADNIK